VSRRDSEGRSGEFVGGGEVSGEYGEFREVGGGFGRCVDVARAVDGDGLGIRGHDWCACPRGVRCSLYREESRSECPRPRMPPPITFEASDGRVGWQCGMEWRITS
jgi:hypothetical protein